MKIDYTKIKNAFNAPVWAYAECYDAVQIGVWNGTQLLFYNPFSEDCLLKLRVFNNSRELMFSGDAYRDTDIYNNNGDTVKTAEIQYYMYGEKIKGYCESSGINYTRLAEERGGALHFPAKLDFGNTRIGLKLCIRSYIRYNPVPVLPAGQNYDYGLDASGKGTFEIFDYAYTGFCYPNEQAVEL